MSDINLDMIKLLRLQAKLHSICLGACVATAIKIRDDAKELSAKDTKFLADSIHVAWFGGSDYNEAKALSMADAEAAFKAGYTPKGVKINARWGRYLFFQEVQPDNPEEVWVVVGAVHGINNEEGLNNRTPFLRPAVEANKGYLTALIRAGFSGISAKQSISNYSVDSALEEDLE